MKKTLAILMALLLLLSAISFASCDSGSKNDDTGVEAPANAEELIEKIQASMEGLKSCTFRANVDVSVEMMEESMTISNETTAHADLENKRVSAGSVTKIDDESMEISFYVDPDVYMIDVAGEKYMGQLDSLGDLAGDSAPVEDEDSSAESGFDAFEEVTMEKESGGYLLKIKGIKDAEDITGLLGDSLGETLEGFDPETFSFLGDTLKGMELTLHTDNRFYLTAAELTMSMTVDMDMLMEQIMGQLLGIFGSYDWDSGFDFNSWDFDFDSDDFDFDFDFDSEDFDFDFDFDSEDFDFDFDFDSEDLDFELGEITVTLKIGLAFSDFDAAADKVVKPSTDGYENVDLADLIDMGSLI